MYCRLFRPPFLCLVVLTLVAGCAGLPDDSASDVQRMESELAARGEVNKKLLLAQRKELQRYHREVVARLERLERYADEDTNNNRGGKALACPPPAPGEKLVFGRVERVTLGGVAGALKARIDTGATTSSLHAEEVLEFERDGRRWVRFHTVGEDEDSSQEVEAPVVRFIHIRQASTDKLERRPVVELMVRLGRVEQLTELSLTSRGDMLYPVLLGRSFFIDIAVVDVSRKFVESKYAPKTPDPAQE